MGTSHEDMGIAHYTPKSGLVCRKLRIVREKISCRESSILQLEKLYLAFLLFISIQIERNEKLLLVETSTLIKNNSYPFPEISTNKPCDLLSLQHWDLYDFKHNLCLLPSLSMYVCVFDKY